MKKSLFLCLCVFFIGSIRCVAQNRELASISQSEDGQQSFALQMDIDGRVVNNKPIVYQTPADSSVIHIVKQGETLYSISNEYGVSVRDIKQWNHLTSNTIQIGEKLKIYPQRITQTSSSSSRPKSTSETGQYTVKPGDTLFHIAQMHQMSVEKLKALNNLTSNRIQVGQTLIVESVRSSGKKNKAAAYGKFIHYTVEKTVSIDSLLVKFEMGKREFLALNPGLNDTTFDKGEQIMVLISTHKSRKNPYLEEKTVKGLGKMMATKYPPNTWGTTTNGELYNSQALTAGSSTLEIGTVVFVKNKQNGRGVFVRINDRTAGDELKLSKAAWNALHLTVSDSKVMVFRANG